MKITKIEASTVINQIVSDKPNVKNTWQLTPNIECTESDVGCIKLEKSKQSQEWESYYRPGTGSN